MNLNLPDDWVRRLTIMADYHDRGQQQEVDRRLQSLPDDQRESMQHMLDDHLRRRSLIDPARKRDVFRR